MIHIAGTSTGSNSKKIILFGVVQYDYNRVSQLMPDASDNTKMVLNGLMWNQDANISVIGGQKAWSASTWINDTTQLTFVSTYPESVFKNISASLSVKKNGNELYNMTIPQLEKVIKARG